MTLVDKRHESCRPSVSGCLLNALRISEASLGPAYARWAMALVELHRRGNLVRAYRSEFSVARCWFANNGFLVSVSANP